MIGDVIVPVLQDLERRGYKYCVLGGEALPEALPGSDIDLMVDRLDAEACAVFETHGFIKSKGIQVFKGSPAVFCKYVTGVGWIPLHVIAKVLHGIIQIAPNEFEKHTVVKGGLKFASDELYVVVTAAQSVIKASITEKRLFRLREKWAKAGFDQEVCFDIAKKIDPRLRYVFTTLIAEGFMGVQDTLEQGNPVAEALPRTGIGGYLRRKFGIGVRRGQIVALEGIDGSGKTTFIGRLNGSVPKKGRELFLVSSMAGRGFVKWSRTLRSYWRTACDKTGWWPSLVKNGMLPLVLLLEIGNSYALYCRAFRKSLLGYNTIFDRYAYLHFVRQVVHNKAEFLGKRVYIRLLSFFLVEKFPAPDMLLYLDLDPVEASRRKQEDDLEDLQAKYALYRDILLPRIREKTELLVIPSKEDSDQLVDGFLDRFWTRLI